MRQPSWRSAATRSPIGRSCIRATPLSSNSPSMSASAAVRGRIAVPALPRKRRAWDAGARPPSPVTSTVELVCRMPQPKARSASSITRVSSESSRSRTIVVPLDKAASSSTRLEMLLEPGSTTQPAALSNGGMSRKSVEYTSGLAASRHAPVRALLAGLLDQLLEALVVARRDHFLHRLERAPEDLRLLQQLLPVGEQDVAPHLGLGRRDASEVAKARAREPEKIDALHLRRDAVHQREGDQVRQVAHGGERGVVRRGRHLQHLAIEAFPHLPRLRDMRGIGAVDGREDHLPAAVEIRIRMFDARHFLAGDRVARHERADVFAQHAPRRVDDVALAVSYTQKTLPTKCRV